MPEPVSRPGGGKSWRRREAFKCADLCARVNGEWDWKTRRQHRCWLDGLGPCDWSDDEPHTIYLGLPPTQTERGYLDKPPENIADDGCPGSWYRLEFISSFLDYKRHCSDGHRSSNPRTDRTADTLILDWLRYYEAQEDAARANYYEVSND